MTDDVAHPLARLLADAATGVFPPIDGVVDVFGPDAAGTEAIVEFTGHSCVLTRRSPDDDVFRGVDAFGGATAPSFVVALAGGAMIGSLDAVLVRFGGAPVDPLPPTGRYDDHPRVRRARHHRRGVLVLGDDTGLATIGSGLVGRTELSVELAHPAGSSSSEGSSGSRGSSGSGRALILGALAHVAADVPVFAQVAPGNAASLRAFLACGFRPIGSEIIIERRRDGTDGSR